jgi:tetratricopeptide (TPR) repeat protein
MTAAASALLVLVLTTQGSPAVLSPELAAVRTQIMSGQPDAALATLAGMPQTAAEVRYLSGLAFYHKDDHLKAIELLAPVAGTLPEGSPERREAVQVLGLSYFVAGRLAEALPLLEQTRAWASDNRELGHVLARTYLQLRRPDDARVVIAGMFDVRPDSAAAHLHTAQQMIRLELYEPAEAELRKALAVDPRAPQAHALLGQLAVARARLDEAVALFRQAIDVNALDAMAYYRLGEAYSRQQKWDEAITALQQSLWINPYFSGPYIVLGRAYMTRKEPATAEGMLRRAVEYDPNNRSAHYLLGQALQALGREDEAAREFEIAARLTESTQQR